MHNNDLYLKYHINSYVIVSNNYSSLFLKSNVFPVKSFFSEFSSYNVFFQVICRGALLKCRKFHLKYYQSFNVIHFMVDCGNQS